MIAPRETVVLETARLRIRPLTAEDAAALHPTYADAELMTYWSGAPHASIDETRAELSREAPEWRRWAITLRDGDGAAIGTLGAGEKRQGNVTEIGYLLARAHWGAGLAHDAVSALIDRIFAEGQRKVFADTDPDNAASRALLERLGFTLEGRLRAEWETHIGVRDTTLYGLLAAEWRTAGG